MENVSNAEVMAAIHELKQISRLGQNVFWTVNDIANYTGFKATTVRKTHVKQRGFPKPVIMPGGSQRWRSAEVKAYYDKRPRG